MVLGCGPGSTDRGDGMREKVRTEKPHGVKVQDTTSANDAFSQKEQDSLALLTDTATSDLMHTDTIALSVEDSIWEAENLLQTDSMEVDFDYAFMDETHDEDQSVRGNKEQELLENRLLKSQLIRVIQPMHKDAYDSVLVVIEDRLSIRPDPVPKQVVLETWQSPVNYRGYQWNRRKLVVFGIDPQLRIAVYHYLGAYYFSVTDKVYVLDEHLEFTPFVSLRDSALSNFLLGYED